MRYVVTHLVQVFRPKGGRLGPTPMPVFRLARNTPVTTLSFRNNDNSTSHLSTHLAHPAPKGRCNWRYEHKRLLAQVLSTKRSAGASPVPGMEAVSDRQR